RSGRCYERTMDPACSSLPVRVRRPRRQTPLKGLLRPAPRSSEAEYRAAGFIHDGVDRRDGVHQYRITHQPIRPVGLQRVLLPGVILTKNPPSSLNRVSVTGPAQSSAVEFDGCIAAARTSRAAIMALST